MLYQITKNEDRQNEERRVDKDIKKVTITNGKINFACLTKDCPEPCCGPFGGVQQGISSIEGRPFSEIVLTPEDSNRLISAGVSNLVELAEDGKYKMKLLADGTCTAFQGGLCSIHPIKPTVCRAFPFYVDMFVGLCCVTACPGFGSGWTPIEDLQDEIQASKEMYQYWLDSIEPQGNTSEE